MTVTTRNSRFFEDNKNELLTIELEYGPLADGLSVTGRVCPKCNGGSTREGSFAVTRRGGALLFVCHRASCGFKGMAALNGDHASAGTEGEGSRVERTGPKRYASLGKSPLPEDVKQLLNNKYGINLLLQAKGLLRWTTQHSPADKGRLVMPMLDHLGYPYGYVARKLDNQDGAKTLTFGEDTEGSWYFNRSSGRKLLIVEDQLSAIKASQFVNTVALLGTNISEQTLLAIKSGAYTGIYLALDADAFPKSIKMAVELRPRLPLSVVRLEKDIKDTSNEDIHKLLSEQGVIS